jgi:UDP-glucose 4-epimerase
VAAGKSPSIGIYGTDYATPDGTCIRDYVHVNDLCQAHLLAMQRLIDGGHSRPYNLGNGSGHSVREVIEVAGRVTGRPVHVVEMERRAGDPDRLVADSTRARQELGWSPDASDLGTIIEHAWMWEQSRLARPARVAAR